MSSRKELELLTRRELQALAKTHGIKASVASSCLIDSLVEVLQLAAQPEQHVVDSTAAPAVEQQQQQQQEEVEEEELSVGAEREALVGGVWVLALVVRINKKTVRVACGKDEYTVKLNEVRIPAVRAHEHEEEQEHDEEEEQGAAYAELDLSLAAYEANDSEEPETIDWLAACCDDAPSDKPAVKAGRQGRQPKSITASMKVTKPAWNSTLKISRESKARESKARKSSVLAATAPVAVPEEAHATATAAPTPAPAPADALAAVASAAATATIVEPTAARRKSFSASAVNPTKTAPAIVPRLNKAAQLMLEARKKKAELERQLALSAPASSGAFTFGAAPAPALPVVHRAPPSAAAFKKTAFAPSSSSSAPSSSSSSSSSSSGATSFKAKALPGFYKIASAPASASAENVSNARPVPASVKSTAINAAAQKTARLSTFVQTGKDKRSSMMASKRTSMAPVPPNISAAAAFAATAAFAPVQAFKPPAHEPLPVGPFGPFSSSLLGK